jgi:signal recognition particle receptor subunit beta
MALFNYTAKEITLKVVYYGPGFSGKTTNIQHLHSILPSPSRGKLISLTTEADRTLFFDFLPVDLGKIKEFNIKFQLYTVPGQVRYNATRRLVLKGADAVVFVADSQKEMKEQNIESFNNMRENLQVNNLDPDDIPVVLQYNKRDIQEVRSISDLNTDLNRDHGPYFEAVAVEGKGVKETFNQITDDLIKHISKKHKVDIESPSEILPTGAQPSFAETPLQSMEEALSPVKVRETVPPRPEKPKPSVTPPPVVGERPAVPGSLDISELVSVIGGLRETLGEINNTFREMLRKQTKISNELFELRQIFSVAKEKKGFKKIFK